MIRGAHGKEKGRKTLESEKSWRNSEIVMVIQAKEDITGTGRDKKKVEEQKDKKEMEKEKRKHCQRKNLEGMDRKTQKIKMSTKCEQCERTMEENVESKGTATDKTRL